MVGIGETYLPAFALAAGMGEIASGLVATVPLLIGSMLQLAAPWALLRCGSFRRWIVPLRGAAGIDLRAAIDCSARWPSAHDAGFRRGGRLLGSRPGHGSGLEHLDGHDCSQPLAGLVLCPANKFSQAGFLAGFVAGGVWLQWGSAWGITLEAFAAAVLHRYGRPHDFRLLSGQSERADQAGGDASHALLARDCEIASPAPRGQACWSISWPCSRPCNWPARISILTCSTQLKLPYWQYVVLVAAAYVSRILALPTLGRFASRFGTKRLLLVGGVGIAPLSAAWLISNSFAYLIALQLTVGVVWAAYELSTMLAVLRGRG